MQQHVDEYNKDKPTEIGFKESKERVRWELISPIGLEELAKVYTFGSTKYPPRNWEKGISFMSMYGALMRHANKWRNKSDNDEESNLHHMAHVAFWALAIIHLSYTRPMFDDR